MSSRTVACTDAGSVITAKLRDPSGVRTARNAFGLSVPVDWCGPRFDGADAFPLDQPISGGLPIDRGLHVLPAEFRRRLGAVDPETVFGQVTAVGGDQASAPGLAASSSAMVAMECVT